MTPDVDVLVGASRSDHPHHAVARHWFEQATRAAEAGPALTLMPMVITSFLCLVTSPKIFQQPTPIEDAMAFVDALLASPGVQLAALGPQLPQLRQLCLDKKAGRQRGARCLVVGRRGAQGEHLVSFDRDFRKLLTRGQFTLLATG